MLLVYLYLSGIIFISAKCVQLPKIPSYWKTRWVHLFCIYLHLCLLHIFKLCLFFLFILIVRLIYFFIKLLNQFSYHLVYLFFGYIYADINWSSTKSAWLSLATSSLMVKGLCEIFHNKKKPQIITFIW